jgi:hypothetical protein
MFDKTGSLPLSIVNLPPQVSRKDLKAHVQGVIDELDNTRLRLTPAICTCSILRLTNPTTGAITHQGLISVQPAKLALRLIGALQNKPLRGRNLQVSRYRHSSFPINTDSPLVSMSDLLGANCNPDAEAMLPLRVDLVSNTGIQEPSGLAPEAPSHTDGLLAH